MAELVDALVSNTSGFTSCIPAGYVEFHGL